MAKKTTSQKDELAQLEAHDTLLAEHVDELKADLQRVQADFVNFRRRTDTERGEIMSLARQDVILQILPLLDNLGRGLTHLPKELKANPWAIGVQQVAKQAEDVLEAFGVDRIQSVGQEFDPNLHEAISRESDGDVVIEELQPGYKMGDKVIRHAIVKVGNK